MAQASPYVAQVRLKWEDGFIDPGEPVPVVTGRNYASMLSLGEIVYVGDGGHRPHPDERPHAGSQAREQSQRLANSQAGRAKARSK